MVVALVLLIIAKGKGRHLITFVTVLALGTAISGGYQGVKINTEFKEYTRNLAKTDDVFIEDDIITPIFQLSKTGTNVLFIFLDRALNAFFPSILEEMPAYKSRWKGLFITRTPCHLVKVRSLGLPPWLGGMNIPRMR